jgi:hypothetical protein
MEIQIPDVVETEVKTEEGQQYIKCVKCKTDKLKKEFRHTLMGRTFKKCFTCTIQGIQRSEYKPVDKAKQRDKQKEYYKSIKGREARERWKNKDRTCPICQVMFKNNQIYNHYKKCKHMCVD